MDRQAVKPPFAYYGGKTTLGPKIAALLPAHDHYIEPFAGSLAVLLAKAPTTWETVNDLDDLLVNFWRVLRERPADLAHVAMLTPHARSEYAASCEDISQVDDELENGNDSRLRIALCGYEGEGHDALLDYGWTAHAWSTAGGYGGGRGGKGDENRHRERIYFSPACIDLSYPDLFTIGEEPA